MTVGFDVQFHDGVLGLKVVTTVTTTDSFVGSIGANKTLQN